MVKKIKMICILRQCMKLHTIFWKEDDMYVIKEAAIGVTTQESAVEEALANIKEAVSLYLEEMPDAKESIRNMDIAGAPSVEIP